MPAEGRSFRWEGWRKGAGSREWLTPSSPWNKVVGGLTPVEGVRI